MKAQAAKVGAAQKIEWDYSGYSGNSVKISLKKDREIVMVIAKDVPITALSYTWTPATSLAPGDDYVVEVSSTQTVYWGKSNNFSIEK